MSTPLIDPAAFSAYLEAVCREEAAAIAHLLGSQWKDASPMASTEFVAQMHAHMEALVGQLVRRATLFGDYRLNKEK